jgi:translation initiation factor 2 alpha subunit (eIF-2alpha)
MSIDKIMDDVNTQQTSTADQSSRDQNVFSFMLQLVQERYGDDTDLEFQNREAERLYDLFGNNLVSYFEPMLSEEQKKQFDQLYKQGGNNESLLGFLTQAIPDLEMKIMQVLVSFRNAYLTEGRSVQPQQN